jgi:ubiquitin-protein ligase
VYLAGPDNTPYAQGVFHLELRMESTYPLAPPTAFFRTKIFHPNVDPISGAVCVDTLKRDWKSELTLRDVLVTISCLLVCPNPASALNAEAGHLMDDDFPEFEQRAAMWSQIHASVAPDLASAVEEAKRRIIGDKDAQKPSAAGKGKKRRGYLQDSESKLPGIENTPSGQYLSDNNRNNAQLGTAHMSNDDAPCTIGLGLNNVNSNIDTPTQTSKRSARKRYAMLPPVTKGNSPQLGHVHQSISTPSLLSPLLQAPFQSTPPLCGQQLLDDHHIAVSPDTRPQKRRRTNSHSPPVTPAPLLTTTSLPRYENPLSHIQSDRDPSNDPFSSSFTMPWLQWEKFLEPPESSKSKAVINRQPRRGIFRF